MKVILNKDLAPLGEEGDVKDVAKGYARNYLFPRGIALPFNESTVRLFEHRREEIEARKAQKRADAAGIKEKLESLNIEITMPAGANGKLYGAVTSQTVADELGKHGHQIERKRIELASGTNIKTVGKYKVTIKLYESAAAEITISVLGQEIKTELKSATKVQKRRRDERQEQSADDSGQTLEQEAAATETLAAAGETSAETAPSAADEAGAPEAATVDADASSENEKE
ncbi:MAG: 50S ribosomal protein L9 [Treponema sp.]|jgi:large subunit ribosomal protein L9|nr:50S ribosomal protein L9 [Treponema sp.]